MNTNRWAVYAQSDDYSGTPELLGYVYDAPTSETAQQRAVAEFPNAWRINGQYEIVYIARPPAPAVVVTGDGAQKRLGNP